MATKPVKKTQQVKTVKVRAVSEPKAAIKKAVVATKPPVKRVAERVVVKLEVKPVELKVKKEREAFNKGDSVVYPVHGVGRVEGTVIIEGIKFYSIVFDEDRMRLKVPFNKIEACGLRRLSSRDRIRDALATLKGRSRVRRVMWSRRAQEYETKINSGDPVSIAEVVRDLHRQSDQPEQSYSERQIYQAALERLARELAAVEKIDTGRAAEKLEAALVRDKKAA
ncbi:MAG: CarD family transcriptional regulator [Alphaproteobacteria bacterium]|nr:MAG: CarD family transcriptional regulator [Alphaproteobacteria bacterium]